MEERIKSAFDFASELTKQLITLATGTIALTVTFLKEIVHPANKAELYEMQDNKMWLFAAWILFLISIIAGLLTMMALTGTLEPKDKPSSASILYTPTVRGTNVTIPSIVQIVAFLLGIIFTAIFGMRVL